MSVGAETSTVPMGERHPEGAVASESIGDQRATIVRLKNAAVERPTDASIRVALGKALLKTGAGLAAEKEFNTAIALGLDEGEIDIALGEALLLQKEYIRALQEVEEKDDMTPTERSAVLRIHGDAKLGLNQVAEACDLFERAVEADERQVEARWGLATCAFADDDSADARRQLELAVDVDPTNAETWILIGDLARTNNDLTEADRAYTRALTIVPESSAALAKRVLTRLAQPDNDAALQDLAQLREIAAKAPATLYLEAIALYSSGNFAQALDKIQQVLYEPSIHKEVDRLAGFIHFRLGNFEQAERYLNRYMKGSKGDLEARKTLAATYLQTNQADQALEVLGSDLDSEDADVLSLAGAAHLAKQDSSTAAVMLERAVELAPESFALNSELGAVLLVSGDARQAQSVLEHAADLETSSDQGYGPTVNLAQAYIRQQEFQKALAAAKSLEERDPDNAIGPIIQGAAYLGLDDVASARKSFERALELQPDSASAALNLVQVDLREGLPQQAWKRLEGVLTVDPDNVQAMLGLAGLAAESGDDPQYVAWLEKAVASEPPALQPRLLLARHYLSTYRADKALAILRGARAAFPRDAQVVALLAEVQMELGKTEDAVISAREAMNAAPNSPMAHFRLAVALLQLGDTDGYRSSLGVTLALIPAEVAAGRYSDAMKISRELESWYPESPLGTVLLGDIYMAQGQFAAAVDAYGRAWRRAQSGTLAIKLHRARSGLGDEDAADLSLAEWVEAHPDDADARLYQAGILEKSGKRQEAIVQYEAVVRQQPDQVSALNNLALLYLAEGDSRAISMAEKAYKVAPDNLLVADTLGWVLLQLGEIDRGAEMIRRAAPLAERNFEVRYHLAVAHAKTGHNADARKELVALLADDRPFAQRADAEALLKSLKGERNP
jgi:putative PEP-CTERM system TPR-repeat lipoprotein